MRKWSIFLSIFCAISKTKTLFRGAKYNFTSGARVKATQCSLMSSNFTELSLLPSLLPFLLKYVYIFTLNGSYTSAYPV